ncbi:MAG TPA: hypothetical protein VG387_04230 [Rhizomicrobium sp.]|jgi:hypothetical protein|nr:hypothetical protein [Rhizomicrobium sp.]
MNRVLGFVPIALFVLMTIPFLLLLGGIRGNDFHPTDTTAFALTFVLNDGAFAQLLSYLQAPVMLALVLTTAVTVSAGPSLPLRLPTGVTTWVLVGACVVAIVVAYLSRYIFAADPCSASLYCKHLSQWVNIDLKTTKAGVSAPLQRDCTALITSAASVLSAIFFGKEK